MLLIELAEKYCAENPQVKSNETVRLLKGAVRSYSRYLDKPAETSDFTQSKITDFIRHRRQSGKAESTIERESTKLVTLWRWGAEEGEYGLKAPRFRIDKAQVDTPVCFLRHEVRRLFREAGRYEKTIGGVPGSVFLVALLSTIWDTAERIGAVRAIERCEFDVQKRSWWPRRGWVTLSKRKRSGKVLVRPLRRSTTRHIRALLAATDAKRPFALVDRTALYEHLNRVLERAGLPASRKHKFHCLRRSHASYLKQAGGDAPASLGHSDPTIAETRYYDPRVTQRWHAIDFLFDPRGLIGAVAEWWGCVRKWFRPGT